MSDKPEGLPASVAMTGEGPVRRSSSGILSSLIFSIALLVVGSAVLARGDDAELLSRFYAVASVLLLAGAAVGVVLRYLDSRGSDKVGWAPDSPSTILPFSIKGEGSLPATITGEASEAERSGAAADASRDRMASRIETEIRDLGWRGQFNLALGMVMAFGALGCLVWFLFEQNHANSAAQADLQSAIALRAGGIERPREWKDVISLQGLRLSLVLLAGGFALFFLRLYRSSLDSIKYYQNELTNIESRYTALAVAIALGDSAITASVVDKLAQTERNFVLKQGETTVELELSRQDGQKIKNMLQALGTNSWFGRPPASGDSRG